MICLNMQFLLLACVKLMRKQACARNWSRPTSELFFHCSWCVDLIHLGSVDLCPEQLTNNCEDIDGVTTCVCVCVLREYHRRLEGLEVWNYDLPQPQCMCISRWLIVTSSCPGFVWLKDVIRCPTTGSVSKCQPDNHLCSNIRTSLEVNIPYSF
jgi:hypothetical protein